MRRLGRLLCLYTPVGHLQGDRHFCRPDWKGRLPRGMECTGSTIGWNVRVCLDGSVKKSSPGVSPFFARVTSPP
ncbi:hypothetical protein BJX96DRAFT_150078 [Aspergillus floccosus]